MKKKATDHPGPAHLRPETAAWYLAVHQTYVLEEHHSRLLLAAAEQWDRATAAREAIDRHGLTYLAGESQTPRPRPEIKIEYDSKVLFSRLLRELALDLAPPPEAPRPPRRGGQ